MQMKNDYLIDIKDLNFKYNHEKVLDNINLQIKRGEFMGLIGPNGSGKTTLLKIITKNLKPTSGNVTLFDKDINDFKDWWRIGYVPQKAGSTIFHFPITVEEIVGLGLVGRKKSQCKTIKEALDAVEMGGFRKRLIKELSGGQQQKVFIARALASNPELLILDEPTAGVDVEAQADFYKLLKNLNTQHGLTLVLVSHDIDVVTNIVTTVACLNGKLICHVPPKEFIKKDYLEKVYGRDLHFIVHSH